MLTTKYPEWCCCSYCCCYECGSGCVSVAGEVEGVRSYQPLLPSHTNLFSTPDLICAGSRTAHQALEDSTTPATTPDPASPCLDTLHPCPCLSTPKFSSPFPYLWHGPPLPYLTPLPIFSHPSFLSLFLPRLLLLSRFMFSGTEDAGHHTDPFFNMSCRPTQQQQNGLCYESFIFVCSHYYQSSNNIQSFLF